MDSVLSTLKTTVSVELEQMYTKNTRMTVASDNKMLRRASRLHRKTTGGEVVRHRAKLDTDHSGEVVAKRRPEHVEE